MGAAGAHVGVGLANPAGRLAHGFQPGIGRVEIGLFALDFRVSDLAIHHARLPMGEERVYPAPSGGHPASDTAAAAWRDPYP